MIHHIIHISDIHIRIGDHTKSRYDEYCNVFSRLRETLQLHQSIIDHTAVIAITGDIFHHKNKLEPYGLELAVKLLQSLSELAHVILIRGNHDYRQDLPNERDMITALMSYSIPNVSYLDHSGLHTFQNLTIGVVAIQDTLLYGAAGGVSVELPPFPVPPQRAEGMYNVAMFHGSITGSTLQNGTSYLPTRNGYPIDWFGAYDAILLGDIHVQQTHRAESIEYKEETIGHSTLMECYRYANDVAPWGYPGSLIQQDFGESITGHGYVVWNLQERSIQAYQLHNPIGFIKIRTNDSSGGFEILHRTASRPTAFVSLDAVIRASWFPSQVKLSVVGSATTLQPIQEYFRLHNKSILGIKYQTDTQDSTKETDSSSESLSTTANAATQINSLDVLVEYVQNKLQETLSDVPDIWKSWLKHPETMLIPLHRVPTTIVSKISDKSDKITKPSQKYLEDFERVQTRSTASGTVQFHSLEWNWILNYGENNFFNFDTNQKQISILNAKNGFGKSNFLETVCISLFGEGFPSRHNKNYSIGIICDKKPAGVTANTHLIFTLNDTRYSLKRVLKTYTSKRSIDFYEIVLSVITPSSTAILHQGQTAVSKWIDDNIGGYSPYLMSAMLSQNADSDFFTLDKQKQKNLMDQILSLDHINSLQALMKSALLYYKSVSEIVDSYSVGVRRALPSIPEGTREQLAVAKEDLNTLHLRRDSLHAQWSSLSEQSLLSMGEYSSFIQQHAARVSYYPRCPLDAEERIRKNTERLESKRNERASLLSRQSSFHAFSDVSNHGGDRILHLIRHLSDPSIDHAVQLMLQYKQQVESHPFYGKQKQYSLYEDIHQITARISDPFTDVHDDASALQSVQQFEAWDTIQSQKFVGYDANAVSSVAQLEKDLQYHQSALRDIPPQITAHTKKRDTVKKSLLKAKQSRDAVSDKRPNKPSVSVKWLEDTQKIIETYESIDDMKYTIELLENSLTALPMLCMEHTRITQMIDDRKTYLQEYANTPFNARCAACKKQSWRIRFDEYQKELPSLEASYADVDAKIKECVSDNHCVSGDLSPHHPSEYLTEVMTCKKEYVSRMDMLVKYEIESKAMDAFHNWTKEHDAAVKMVNRYESDYESLTLQIASLQQTLQVSTTQVHQIQGVLDMRRKQQVDYSEYTQERDRRLQEYTTQNNRLIESWYNKLYLYRESIAAILHMIDQGLTECDASISEMEAEQNRLTESIQIRDRIASDKKRIDAYPSWTAWKECNEQEKALLVRIREYEVMIRTGSMEAEQETSDEIRSLHQTIHDWMTVAQQLSVLFDGYRKWLYSTHIAPMLHQRVNHILQLICDDRVLQLDSEWLDTIDTLSWFIKDGTSRVIIEKASGFQRFIVGIAVRVAFHQIGFCRVRFHQLFIDEGFTACDADHLERVPSFLHGILPYYSSIYLVTHLEDLKSSTTNHIYISRTVDGLSRIQYSDGLNGSSSSEARASQAGGGGGDGSVVVAVAAPPPRRRGRPPKNSVTISKS